MAKSSRGGMTVYEKQEVVISQFERINRAEARRTTPTWLEQQIIDSRKRNEEYQKSIANKKSEPRISFYNPNNPLNGFNSKSAEERKAITAMLKQQEKAAKKAAQENA